MKRMTIKDVEPVEVLEDVVLHFKHFNDEMPGDERPRVDVYRYRFEDNFGVEFSLINKLRSGHLRFLTYENNSNTIKIAGDPVWTHKGTFRTIIRLCLGTSEKSKSFVEMRKKELK